MKSSERGISRGFPESKRKRRHFSTLHKKRSKHHSGHCFILVRSPRRISSSLFLRSELAESTTVQTFKLDNMFCFL